jgi:2-haloacid dehalogenase
MYLRHNTTVRLCPIGGDDGWYGRGMASERREIEAVVFDLGGVLIDWDPRYVYRQLFADPADMEEFLGSVCTPDWHRAHDLGADVTQSCEQLALRYPEHRDMIMVWAKRGEEMVAGQFDDTVELLSELKASGMPCYALSNMEPDAFEVRRARFGFMRWFDAHVISGLEGVAKPDRRIFEILLHRHGLRPQRCVFIDDQARNVDAARDLGLVALHFSSAAQLRQDLHALGAGLTGGWGVGLGG